MAVQDKLVVFLCARQYVEIHILHYKKNVITVINWDALKIVLLIKDTNVLQDLDKCLNAIQYVAIRF